MNKMFANANQLKKAIFDYLKGVAGDKDANIHRITDLIHSSPVDKMMAVTIYSFISRDPNNKLSSIIRLFDKKLMEYRPYSFQSQPSENFSLALHVHRLLTLTKYALPYEETVQALLEHILINQLTNIDFLTLIKLLEYHPQSYSKSYHKLAANILDLLQEHLVRTPASPSFITSVSKSLSKSPFRLSPGLRAAINETIDRSLPFFTFPQMTELSHQMREKSLQQWMQVGNLQTSLIRKRVIYQYIINKQYPGFQYSSFLPGRQWNLAVDLEEAVKCVRSLGVKEPYIDIFPTVGTPYTNPAEGYATLEHPEFVNHYIEHVFTYIKNNYKKIDYYSLFKIVRTLRSLFSEGATVEPNAPYFENLSKRYNINLINLLVIIYELGRYPVAESAELRRTTGLMLQVLFSVASSNYFQQFNYKNYKHQQLMLVFAFMHCKIVDTLSSKQPSRLDFFKKIQVFLQFQRQKKHEVSEYSRLLAFYRFAKALLEIKQPVQGTKNDILLQEEVSSAQIKSLLEPYLQVSHAQTQNLDSNLEIFLKKYKIIHNVLLQPNLQVKYAIVSRESPKIRSVFEYKDMLIDKLIYESTELLTQENVRITSQEDLSLQGLWKKNFFNLYYKCQYLYCQSDLQLSYKLHKRMKQLWKE